MFLLSKPVELEKINFDATLGIDETEKSKSQRRQSLIFLQDVLQNTELRSAQAFSPNCCVLLNYVNVLRPTQYVKVVKTASKKKQNEENLNEFLKIAEQAKYKTSSFPKADYLNGTSSSQKDIASVILYLKKVYEKKGICPASEKEVRTFYLLETSKTKKNAQNLKNQAIHINPYFVTKKELQDFKENKSMQFSNIFYKSKKSMAKFINERTKQINKGDNSSGSGLSSMSDSNSNSNSDSDKEKSGESKSDFNDLLKSGDNKDDSNSENSDSGMKKRKNDDTSSNSNFDSISDKENKKRKNKGWPKSKGFKKDNDSSSGFDQLKMSSNKSSGTSDNSDSEREIEIKKKKKRNTKTKMNKKKTSNTKTNKRKTNQTQKMPKSITETLFKTGKYVIRSATLPSQVHTELQNKKGNSKNLFKLSKAEDTHEIIPLPISEENIYIAKTINKHFKATKQNKLFKDPKKREYIHLIYYIINTIDKWGHNSQKQSTKYLKECGFKNLPLLFKQAYLDTVNLGKNGHAMFQIMIANSKNKKFVPAIMELTTQNFKIKKLKDKSVMISQPLNKYPFQIALNKLDPSEISIKKQQDNYLIKFMDSVQCICGVMTLAYFFTTTINNLFNSTDKQKNSKNFAKTINRDIPFIGKNPQRSEHSKQIEELAECVMPPLVSPNEKFNQLLSGTNFINMKSGKNQIMMRYMEQGGVNFLVAILNRNEFPLSCGYFKIRKNYFKIGVNGYTLFKIPWSARPHFFVNPNNKLVFSIDWTPTATCTTNQKTSIIAVCSRNSERSLITNTLTYFKYNWNEQN
ncbi:hepatoma-derived growth factor-related [Anaeramoeba flamelloides]|uniref:Hepatoma-derived growth factor-related n=1 Tax=Anaeramoeba flamelloides TaxID=1746091 RepID=A0AAV7Y0I0_9EUKA|nr:hepatoma-derived growth factor-related [Anaeramoeba flamelloides]